MSDPASPGVVIRPARADEADAVAAVHVEADWQTYAPIFGPRAVRRDLAASKARWAAALAAGEVFLVAEEGGRLVELAHAAGEQLSALYLLSSHHRRGLGARMLAEVCARLAQRGVAEIGFQCVAANERAIAFYLAQGARLVGRKIEGEGEETWEDVVFRLKTDGLDASRAT